jgi:hypothetical protein
MYNVRLTGHTGVFESICCFEWPVQMNVNIPNFSKLVSDRLAVSLPGVKRANSLNLQHYVM